MVSLTFAEGMDKTFDFSPFANASVSTAVMKNIIESKSQ